MGRDQETGSLSGLVLGEVPLLSSLQPADMGVDDPPCLREREAGQGSHTVLCIRVILEVCRGTGESPVLTRSQLRLTGLAHGPL